MPDKAANIDAPIRALIRSRMLPIMMLLGFGTFGYMVVEGLSSVDALYLTVITLSTVGYGEPAGGFSTEGRLFTVVLIIAGIGLFSWAISSFVSALISGEVRDALGRRRTRRHINRMDNHFIICGYGRLGRAIAGRFLTLGTPFVVVDPDVDSCARAKEQGIHVIQDDATDDKALLDAGIESARGLISACPKDEINVFIVLSAKQLRPDLLVLSRAIEENAEQKLMRAGASRVFRPHDIGGIHIAQAALRPHLLDFYELTSGVVGDVEIQLEEIRVGNAICGSPKTLSELNIGKNFGVIVIGIHHGENALQFNPGADSLVHPGDMLLVLGKPDQLRKLESHLEKTRTIKALT